MNDFKVFYDEEEDIFYLAKEGEADSSLRSEQAPQSQKDTENK